MKIYILLINVIVGFACTSTEHTEKVLSKSIMIDLLIETHLLEGKIDKLNLKKDSAAMVFNTLQNDLFVDRQVDKKFFEKSFIYYLEEVNQMDAIYAVVVDSLNVIQKRGYISENPNEELSEADSTKLKPNDKVRMNKSPKIDSVKILKYSL